MLFEPIKPHVKKSGTMFSNTMLQGIQCSWGLRGMLPDLSTKKTCTDSWLSRCTFFTKLERCIISKQQLPRLKKVNCTSLKVYIWPLDVISLTLPQFCNKCAINWYAELQASRLPKDEIQLQMKLTISSHHYKDSAILNQNLIMQ